jgi:hypothetical protein
MRIAKTPLEEVDTELVGAMTRSRSPLRFLIAIFVLLVLPSATVLQAQDFSKPTGYLLAQSQELQVWANTATGVYHYPGTRWYGHAKQGKNMTEKDAIAQGFRAARNGQ